ncbi:MAG: hypothetical protein D6710_05120 [Nitrospirae bacterium]|nr:MAG: hypothetical protein D6710_05120 [Nitrospirota bacterium]
MKNPDIVLCKEDEILLLRDGAERPEPLTLKSVQNLPAGYILILPDSLINLVYTDIEPIKRKKLAPMVRLYLEGISPEKELSEDDYGYLLTKPVIAFFYTDRYRKTLERLGSVFERASAVTVPSLIALLSIQGSFYLKTERTCLIKDNRGFVHIHGDVEGLDPSSIEKVIDLTGENCQELVGMVRGLLKGGAIKSIDIKSTQAKDKKGFFAQTKKDLLFWAVLYLFLIAGVILRIMPVKKEIALYQSEIQRIYSKAGVSKEADPYGMLLFKLKKLKGSREKTVEPIRVLYALSEAFEGKAVVESISLGREYLRIKGKANDLEGLDRAINHLKGALKIDFKTEAAKVGKEGVTFSISGKVK